jgi:hypothetical protein
MRTDELIDKLTAAPVAVSPSRRSLRLIAAMAIGFVVASTAVGLSIRFQPGMPGIMLSGPMLMKWSFTLSVAALGAALLHMAARPEARLSGVLWLTSVPFLAMALWGLGDIFMVDGDRVRHWLGGSWYQCLCLIVLYAAPVFALLLWAFRPLAPTDLRLTGLVAGLVAGGVGAAAYALHCPENAVSFVATWYALGIGATGAIGALLGPRFLRW